MFEAVSNITCVNKCKNGHLPFDDGNYKPPTVVFDKYGNKKYTNFVIYKLIFLVEAVFWFV